ncbi:hypothetical protein [Leptothoe sp. PORK10 BA2]|uniref:hypothetical protein n=1 Tax=Leptothoe sp. PORK10 BA2 TaxID=3110254 RepID=UPI002B1FB289|nr:hypothetical protein [Leptothoe sp. PORK10 BA2]MEA5463910.1 hypothetical protein [Leptothoe sp. PORK10 BA2]
MKFWAKVIGTAIIPPIIFVALNLWEAFSNYKGTCSIDEGREYPCSFQESLFAGWNGVGWTLTIPFICLAWILPVLSCGICIFARNHRISVGRAALLAAIPEFILSIFLVIDYTTQFGWSLGFGISTIFILGFLWLTGIGFSGFFVKKRMFR